MAGDGDEESSKNKATYASSSASSAVQVVGLKILTQTNSQGKSNVVVVKPALKISFPVSRKHSGGKFPADDDDQYSCFLKSCHLCRKNLSLDKEVYMYR